MRQGWSIPLCLALALGTGTFTSAPLHAAAKSAAASARSTKAKNTLRQFTGYVSAVDKTTLTVEKRGKQPRTLVFTKHEDMSVVGEIEKDARVTVYYRDESGHSVAHRVVVKASDGGSSTRG
jgi:hypothetical protein